jgi:hypothetical protein
MLLSLRENTRTTKESFTTVRINDYYDGGRSRRARRARLRLFPLGRQRLFYHHLNGGGSCQRERGFMSKSSGADIIPTCRATPFDPGLACVAMYVIHI